MHANIVNKRGIVINLYYFPYGFISVANLSIIGSVPRILSSSNDTAAIKLFLVTVF